MKTILLILFCITAWSMKAQVGISINSSALPEWNKKQSKLVPHSTSYSIELKNSKPKFYLLPNSTNYIPPTLIPIKIDHAPGLFCKIECKLEAKSKLLPRFRLGSLQYTEWMEGKRNDFYSPGLR